MLKRFYLNGLLKNHIESLLITNGITNVSVSTNVVKSVHTSSPDIYAIIVFTKIDGTPICHLTFHLIHGLINEATNGPIHIVNDQSIYRRQRIRVALIGSSIHEGIVLSKSSLTVPGRQIRCPELIMASLTILNAYLNPLHELSLTRSLSSTVFLAQHDTVSDQEERVKTENIIAKLAKSDPNRE